MIDRGCARLSGTASVESIRSVRGMALEKDWRAPQVRPCLG